MARKARTPKAGAAAESVAPTSDFNGADPAAFDHDQDGAPGGSKKRPKVGDAEYEAICREAFEAYDFQDERVRFDSIGRRWQFRPDKLGPASVLSLEVSRLLDKTTDTIPTPVLASDLGQPMVADVIKAMMERLG